MQSPRAFLHALEQIGIKLGLEQIRGLVGAMNHPERAFPAVTIAGTNGKGSVTAMLERGLRAAGYRTGRFTSPHLITLEERFAINGISIEAAVLDEALAHVQAAAAELPAPPTFFEATTAAALDLFRTAGLDVALLEVGLGGRLDATNVVDALASVITSIDFDHQQFLGDSIEGIAAEKAGVIKPTSLCVLAQNPPSVRAVIADRCRAVGAELIDAVDGVDARAAMTSGRVRLELRTPIRTYSPVVLGLRGRHQVPNAIAAIRCLEELDRRNVFAVSAEAVLSAVRDVVWPGRLELAEIDGRAVLIDGAHNAAGAAALATFLREAYPGPLPIVLGVMEDKDVAAIAGPLIAVASRFVCTAAASPRAMPPHRLATVVAAMAPHLAVSATASPASAVTEAGTSGSPVVVAGSLFLAGEVRAGIS